MIVPRIDIVDGRAAGLAGEPLERLEHFALAGVVAVTDLDAAEGRASNRELIERMVRRVPCRVAAGIGDPTAARAWLDAGARQVVVDASASLELFVEIPRERLVAELVVSQAEARGSIAFADLAAAIGRLAPHVGGLILRPVAGAGALDDAALRAVVAVAAGARVTVAGGIRTPGEVAALDRLGVDAEVGAALADGGLSLADAIAAPLPRGRGLWPTVVCDESGAALGLAWSSLRSLRRAVADRRGVYWSRSRREVWVKGATSGNAQALLAIALDCDRDALRFTVRQEGTGFCHTGTRSCWGDDFDLGALERTLLERRAAPPAGSGTARLIADPGLLAGKLVEEARELAEAADGDAAVQEAADLMYFALSALVAKGGRLADVVDELERRSLRVTRRPMATKP